MNATRRGRAFTITELLIVLMVISILVAILLPTVMNIRDRARIAECKEKLKEFERGIALYRLQHDDFEPPWLTILGREQGNYADMPREFFFCPADLDNGEEGAKVPEDINQYYRADWDDWRGIDDPHPGDMTRYDTYPCSYLYEASAFKCSWVADPQPDVLNRRGPLPSEPGGFIDWWEAKMAEHDGRPPLNLNSRGKEVTWGGRVPIVRCFHHSRVEGGTLVNEPRVINLRWDSRVYLGWPDWKNDHALNELEP